MTIPDRKKREERLKKICDAINKAEKSDDIITWIGSGETLSLERFPSGCKELDFALGGGWPRGRFIEVFGPESAGKTTVCLHAIVEHQKKYPDEDVALVDTEFSFDTDYAKGIGVDTDLLLVHQPSSGEQALKVVRHLIHHNVGLIIVDSVAALTPQAEIDGEIGDQHVGQQARLMTQTMRILTGEAAQRNVTVFWTNQMRDKIGVCFEYHVPVLMADGTTEWIGKIVNQKMKKKVMSYDPDTGLLVPRSIKNWVYNGTLPKDEKFVKIHVNGASNAGKGGQRGITATKSHMIFTPIGEKPAGEIQVGEQVLVNDWQYFTPEHHELILGSLLGDGGLRFEKGSPRGHIRFHHCAKQTKYCQWKASCFGLPIHREKNGTVWFNTRNTQELREYCNIGKKKAVRFFPLSFVHRITPKVVAIWYQDDGTYGGTHERWGWGKCSITAKCLSKETLEAIAAHLQAIGMGKATVKKGRGLEWNGDNSRLFQQAIAQFVHVSMRYKIKKGMAPFSWNLTPMKPVLRGYARVVTKKEFWTPPPGRGGLFDLEIENYHSYVAGGIIVHNTWGDKTTQPGGHALRHHASIRVGMAAISKEKDGDEIVGVKVQATVKKNKTSAPFKKAEFYISFGTGIDSVAEVCDAALIHGIVKRRGAKITFGDQIIGNGRKDFLAVVKKDPELKAKLEEAVRNAPPPEEVEEEKSARGSFKKPKGMSGVNRVPVEREPEVLESGDASRESCVEAQDA